MGWWLPQKFRHSQYPSPPCQLFRAAGGQAPHGQRLQAGSQARHVGHVGHVAGKFGPAASRLNGRQAGAGSGQLPRHVLASDRAGSERLGAKCTIEKSYRVPIPHNFALS